MINILIQYDLENVDVVRMHAEKSMGEGDLVPIDVCMAFFDLRAHGLPPVVGVKAKPGS
jgi:hypothetical protein